MGVRVYGSRPLRAAQEAKDAADAELIARLKPLLQGLPAHLPRGLFPPRRPYPADARWNANRKQERRRRWLVVGNLDGSGFTRHPGPYRLPEHCPEMPGTVVWYGKDISERYVSETTDPETTP